MRFELIQKYYDSPEYLAKLRQRVNNLKRMEADPYSRAKAIQEIYAVDPIAFIEDFGFLKVNAFNGKVKPFFMFPYQKNIINKIQEAELSNQEVEMLFDKPRAMGVTYLISIYILWRWLFTANFSAFILSRTETEVDDGLDQPDNSIFGKLRFQISMLPDYILPESFEPKKNRGTPTDSILKLINPELKSAIIGSSTNANAGRSRRYSFVYVDECFFVERFNEVWRSLQSVATLKVFTSTVKPGRQFEDFKNLIEKSGHYHTLSWQDHPWKDQIWYEEQLVKAEFDPEVMKEISADYSINAKSRYYPELEKAEVKPLLYDPSKPLYVSLDFGRQDLTVLVWSQYTGRNFHILESYENKQRNVEWYVPYLNPEVDYNPDSFNPTQIEFINKVRGWRKPVAYFGEQDHFSKKMPFNKSTADVLREHRVRLFCNSKAIQHPPRRAASVRLFPKTIFNESSDGAMRIYDALAQSRYAGAVRTTTEQLKPVHDDEISDRRSAFENLAVNVHRIIKSQREDPQDEDDKSFARAMIKSLS